MNKLVDKPVETKISDSLWELAFDQINDQWMRGVDLKDDHFSKNCPQYSSKHEIARELRSCRALLLSCYYKDRKEKLSYKKDWFNFSVKFTGATDGLYALYSPSREAKHKSRESAVEVELIIESENKRESKKVFLKDECRQVSLPQGFYRYGSKSSNEVWHPSQVTYSVDRYLVRNIDIEEWLSQIKPSFLKEKINYQRDLPFEPATSLTSSQMVRYCSFKGAQILEARVLDAVTYHHGRASIAEISLRPPGPNTSPYPFGPRVVDSPHYFALKKNTPANFESCKKIYSQECIKLAPKVSTWGLGWSGVKELLGGPLEFVRNNEMPRRNLKLSSFYFELSSRVHQAGVKGFWNGSDYLRPKSFNFFRYSTKNSSLPYKVGFRCMSLSGSDS